MKCPVCGDVETTFFRKYQSYLDYSVDLFDCGHCGSRFTLSDSSAHEKLHSLPSSYYGHAVMENRVADLLHQGDIAGVRSYLSRRAANAFVMETLDAIPEAQNILEIGCSRGYLTAYFLATGRNVLGVDVSQTAVGGASRSFGDHFCVAGSKRIQMGAPYDAIYHIGTIGCVESPAQMTRDLIAQLKPGGVLVFNAPNRKSCDLSGRDWLSTPPPDLITIFHPDYWQNGFADIADSKVDILIANPGEVGFIRRYARKENKPSTALFDIEHSRQASLMERIINRMMRTYYSIHCAESIPSEYGIHVVLRRKT
ncbi:MAG: methyltransferase domain-containing protein [Sulfuritalea sp.]|nr:methyltransferase domain-containing protein [Sulfuritalea sp.]